MKRAVATLLACALLLPGCESSHRLHDSIRVRDWDPAQARDVLRGSLWYAAMRDIHVGEESFSYVEPLSGPVVDTCERHTIRYDDIGRVELDVTEVDYRVILHLRSRHGSDGAEFSFSTRRTAHHCADAFATLCGHR